VAFREPPRDVLNRYRVVFLTFLPPAVDALQQFPGTIITSWFRSPEENAAVGGHPRSQHLVGWAFDVVAPQGQAGRLADALRRNQFEAVVESDHVHAQVFTAGVLEALNIIV